MFVICPKCAAKYRIPPEITLKEGQKVQCSACRYIFDFQQNEENISNESLISGVHIPDNPVLSPEKSAVNEEKMPYLSALPEVFQPLKQIPTDSGHSRVWLWMSFCLLIVLLFTIWFYREKLNADLTTPYFQMNRSLPRIRKVSNKNLPYQSEEIPLFIEDADVVQSINLKNKNVPLFSEAEPTQFSFHSVHFYPENNNLLIKGYIYNEADYDQMLPQKIYATAYNQQGHVLFQKEIYLPKEALASHDQKAFFSTYSPAPAGIQWMEVSCKK